MVSGFFKNIIISILSYFLFLLNVSYLYSTMGDDTEWLKLPTEEKCQHKVMLSKKYLYFLLVLAKHGKVQTYVMFWHIDRTCFRRNNCDFHLLVYFIEDHNQRTFKL